MSCVNMKNIIKKIALFWATIAPGIFLVGYNIGTGSITTMASAGASYGMTLTWALALSCLFTYVLIIAFSRYTIITVYLANLHTSFLCNLIYPTFITLSVYIN